MRNQKPSLQGRTAVEEMETKNVSISLFVPRASGTGTPTNGKMGTAHVIMRAG